MGDQEGSARVLEVTFVQEEDLLQRSRKKSKRKAQGPLQDVDIMHDEEENEESVRSYEDKLLDSNGTGHGGKNLNEKEGDEEWFREGINFTSHISDEDRAKYPEVPVSDEEFLEWCKPWKGALVAKVLGRKVSFKILENKIQREWAKKGKGKIVDMPRGYYLVQFPDADDYHHALF